jgi:hypothetical protein
LESDPFCPDEFGSWMESTLGRIGSKKDAMFRINSELKETSKNEDEDCLLEEHRKIYRAKTRKILNIREKGNEEY